MKLKLIAAALLAGTSIASAADLPKRAVKAPIYVAPVYNWTGVYIGGHLGAAFSDRSVTSSPALAAFPFATSGNDSVFLGGGQLGADYQFAPNWVIGIEGQISGTSGDDFVISNAAIGSIRDKTDWLGSVTGRLGYTWGPGLIYGKGGVAFRDSNGLGVFGPTGAAIAFTSNRNDTGYTVGGGLEYLFAPAWSAKVEYQYYNFDDTTVSTVLGTLGTFSSDIHTVKVGLNYHFNWASPVVAKY